MQNLEARGIKIPKGVCFCQDKNSTTVLVVPTSAADVDEVTKFQQRLIEQPDARGVPYGREACSGTFVRK
jgi:hypothetical protein